MFAVVAESSTIGLPSSILRNGEGDDTGRPPVVGILMLYHCSALKSVTPAFPSPRFVSERRSPGSGSGTGPLVISPFPIVLHQQGVEEGACGIVLIAALGGK